MCIAQGPQRSDAGEARTRYPSASSQALYHWDNNVVSDKLKVSHSLMSGGTFVVHVF